MSKLARYLPVLKKKKNGEGYRASVHKDPYGKYVLFEEHARKVAAVQAKLTGEDKLRKRIQELELENIKLRSYLNA
ncbi:MAG: hypothetical protein RBR16_09380 [Syntrophus sp. (in: bacteria)]|nr:hypothetical protein [Syntrophus sp. (in: bacteria)]